MREILFRGKPLGNYFHGKFIYGSLGVIDTGLCAIYHCFEFEDDEMQLVDSGSVGQFTGLTDKNGKKIFEGDIIRYADNDEYEMYLESLECPEEYEGVDFSGMWTVDEVVYGDKIGYPAFDLNAHDFECNGLAELSENGDQWFYEVIGNIHDNPELLEVQK